jgi:hypothetical protein
MAERDLGCNEVVTNDVQGNIFSEEEKIGQI